MVDLKDKSDFFSATLEAWLTRQTHASVTVSPHGYTSILLFAGRMVDPWDFDSSTGHELAGKEVSLRLSASPSPQPNDSRETIGEIRFLAGLMARRQGDDLDSTQPPIQVRLSIDVMGQTTLTSLAQAQLIGGRHIVARLEVLKPGPDKWRAADFVEDVILQVVKLELLEASTNHSWAYPG